MFRFPFQWMLRRHIWAAVLVLRVYLERRADQLNQSKSQEHLCPCTAHFSWHLVALSQNFSVKLVIMFKRGKITWKFEKHKKTNKQTAENKKAIKPQQVWVTSVPCTAHSCWHLTALLGGRLWNRCRKLALLTIEKCHTFCMLSKPAFGSHFKKFWQLRCGQNSGRGRQYSFSPMFATYPKLRPFLETWAAKCPPK